jgi:molybdenum-dependent DNA-binding transcriptional regulator ModE
MARSQAAPAWRRAFLRELARGGSVALAAGKVGIDRSSAYQAYKGNPAFAASWDRALERAREALGRGERVLRDDEVVRASKAGRPCVVRAGPGRWSTGGERAFLAELATTANIKAAARAAGVSDVAAYNRRRQWPAFAAAWREAKAEGYERLELALICRANATLDPEPEVAARDDAFAAMSVGEAIKLLFHHLGGNGGRTPRYGWRRQEPDIEEVRAEILRKVEAMERAGGRTEE